MSSLLFSGRLSSCRRRFVSSLRRCKLSVALSVRLASEYPLQRDLPPATASVLLLETRTTPPTCVATALFTSWKASAGSRLPAVECFPGLLPEPAALSTPIRWRLPDLLISPASTLSTAARLTIFVLHPRLGCLLSLLETRCRDESPSSVLEGPHAKSVRQTTDPSTMALHPAVGPASHATEDSVQATQSFVADLVDFVPADLLFAGGYSEIATKSSLDPV